MELTKLGKCPTGEHVKHPQCGYIGCMDLRIWAKANRFRYRLEESHKAEDSEHVRGDGRWYVEILCKRGLIYPKGGRELLVFTTSTDAWMSLVEIGVKPKRMGDKEREGEFPVEILDQVAAILKPRRRRTLSPDRARAISGLKGVSIVWNHPTLRSGICMRTKNLPFFARARLRGGSRA